jgi:hypothetical protein
MGSIVPLTRRAPLIRGKRITPDDSESREAAQSMRILLWTFALTALAMCGTVVACFANSWAEVWLISSFLLVFTLCKIGLANALFYVMIHYDANREAARAAQAAASKAQRSDPILRPTRRRRILRPRGALRVAATSAKSPRPGGKI